MALKNLSFVERRLVLLDANEAEKVKLAAKQLLACEPQLSDMRYFEKATGCGLSETGHILIGDTSQIAAPKRFSDFFLEYRLSLLAGEDDLVLIARGRYTDYESYVGKILENSETSFIAIGGDDYPGKQASPVICLNDRDSFGLLVEYASGQHELTLVPHMATGAVWSLARKLGLKLGTKVLVAGPPPRLSARVNDKVWFASTLKKLMGD